MKLQKGAGLLTCLSLAVLSSPSWALSEGAGTDKELCQIKSKGQMNALLREPGRLEKETTDDGEVLFDLRIQETCSQLFNPATGRDEPVSLRSYVPQHPDPEAPYVAPMIEMVPGQTARVTLKNRLDPEASCEGHPENVNEPHCFNGTNLHTHGLWISPAGNSDNVLVKVNPQVDFQYEYNVPPDHPAGTFWYHPHLHGSTALQVSSGMAGALIIRGDRQPVLGPQKAVKRPGDLDVLLKGFEERTFVMQQIAYACFWDDSGTIITRGDIKGNEQLSEAEKGQWACPTADQKPAKGGNFSKTEMIGQIPGDKGFDAQFGPGSWPASGRFTSINGVVMPTVSGVKVGAVERWRMIHAGVRDTIDLMFCRAEGVENERALMASTDPEAFTQANCIDARDKLAFQVVASDGLTMAQTQRVRDVTLQPGYRWDLLVQFPEVGDWYMIDRAATAQGSVNANTPTPRFLGVVKVEGNEAAPASLEEQLVEAAKRNIQNPAVRQLVVSDLKNGLQLTAFEPHKDLIGLPAEEFGRQEVGFMIDVTTTPPEFMVANQLPESSDWDPQPYSPDRIDRNLVLGAKDEWVMGSGFVGHPFHIHVNPFQIVRILNPEGEDVSGDENNNAYFENAAGARFDTQEACKASLTEGQSCTLVTDTQYRGLKGLWKDTIFVKQGYKVYARTHYRRYIGDFVLHCHILDHEDQGMMQNVRISVGDAQGQPASAHGSH